jgi:hypothetical protein
VKLKVAFFLFDFAFAFNLCQPDDEGREDVLIMQIHTGCRVKEEARVRICPR